MPQSDTPTLEKIRAYREKAQRMRELALLVNDTAASPALEEYAAELERRAAELEGAADGGEP